MLAPAFTAWRGRKGETLTGGPHGAAREGGSGRAPTSGPYSAERGEKGEGACGLTAAERATPLGHARAAGEGAGPPTAQGQGPSVGGSLARVCASPDLGVGVDTKEKTLLNFQSCKFG